MKKIIVLTMLLAFTSSSFGQQIAPKQDWKETDYYKKSKIQKIAAYTLTSVGMAGLLITLAYDATNELEYSINRAFAVESDNKSYAGPYLLSTACIISGICFGITSSNNKKKAKAASVFMDLENVPLLNGTVFNNQSFPSVGVKIPL